MTTIKIKTIDYILCTLMIVLIGLFLAQHFQIEGLNSKYQAVEHEVASLRAEQEYISELIAGQTQPQERTDIMALANTGRVFSIEKYRQWNKANSGGNRLPDWVHACNGQPVLKENGTSDFVRGLDGEYRPSAPEWEVPYLIK